MTDKIRKATHDGTLIIAGVSLPCVVLEDGTRVLSMRGVNKALGRGRGGSEYRRKLEDGGAQLPGFLSPNDLKPFVGNELTVALSSPLEYKPPHGGRTAFGVEAGLLPKICEVWLDAKDAGALSSVAHKRIAATAQILMRGLAHVGIIALVDEATGYQEIRDRLALQAILDKYLRKELAAWAKRFPNEFYEQIFRLKGWQWQGMKINRPSVVGKYTNDIVYERLAPGILKELRERNPKDETGQRKAKHHQWFTEDVGHPALAQHLHAVIGFMRATSNWEQFYRFLQRAFPKRGENIELPLEE